MTYLTMLEALDWCRKNPGVNECACRVGKDAAIVRISPEGVQQAKWFDRGEFGDCEWSGFVDFTKIEPEVGWEEKFRKQYSKPQYRWVDVETALQLDRLIFEEVDRRIAKAKE